MSVNIVSTNVVTSDRQPNDAAIVMSILRPIIVMHSYINYRTLSSLRLQRHACCYNRNLCKIVCLYAAHRAYRVGLGPASYRALEFFFWKNLYK